MHRNRYNEDVDTPAAHSKLRQIVGWRRSANDPEDDLEWLEAELEVPMQSPVTRTRARRMPEKV